MKSKYDIFRLYTLRLKLNRKETVPVEADPYGNQHKADQRMLSRLAPGM